MYISMVSCQKGPTRHAYAWQLGPFWQDTLDICDPNLVITVSADGLATNGARPSEDTVLSTQVDGIVFFQ